MKKQIINSILVMILSVSWAVAQQSMSNHINTLTNYVKHTTYQDFTFYHTAPAGALPGSVHLGSLLPSQENATMKAHFSGGESKNSKFVGEYYITVGKYDINPNVITLLTRHPGFPASYKLINFKLQNGVYTPVARLSVLVESDGDPNTYFCFKNNRVVTYFLGESYGKGATYEVANNGDFTLVHQQDFEGANFHNVFTYSGGN